MPPLLTVKVTGLNNNIARINRLEDRLKDMEMAEAVRKVGEVWQQNFNSEGGAVGGWKPLTLPTQRLRQLRFFQPAHPILHQTGGLRNVAINMVTGFSGRSNMVGGAGVDGWIQTRNNRTVIAIVGEKVENQYGGQIQDETGETRNLPARPFWFVDGDVEAAAAEGMEQEIHKITRRA